MISAAENLSLMMDRPIEVEIPDVETIPIEQVVTYAGSPETEMVGVYLLIDGDLHGQALLLLPMGDAFYLVDVLMGLSSGSTTSLDDLAHSALAEIGNITLAGFLNAVADLTGKDVRPSPPAVVIDMDGAILEMIATSIAAVSDELIVAKTNFKDADKVMQFGFWILPNPAMDIFNN